MTRIDLNCDMGESYGAWQMGADSDVMPWITSANVACGFHAGDPVTMRRTLAAAAAAGVAVGAHVALPDLAGFGRRAMAISGDELYAMTVVQLGAVRAMATCHGVHIGHIKPHGALYHMLETDAELASHLVAAVKDVDATLQVFGSAGGQLCATATDVGLEVAHEAFCDRAYTADGQLVSRREPGAVIESTDAAVNQAIALTEGRVCTTEGNDIAVNADTLCVHGDRPDAAAFAQALHTGLRDAGVNIRALMHATA